MEHVLRLLGELMYMQQNKRMNSEKGDNMRILVLNGSTRKSGTVPLHGHLIL